MAPFSKSSTCGSTLEQQPQPALRRELHPNSNQSLQYPSEAEDSSHASSPQPSPSVTAIAITAMSSAANNQIIRSHSSDSINSQDTTTPFLVTGGSDSSNDGNPHNTNNVQHPLIHCHHRHEPHPNYQSSNQYKCRPEYNHNLCHDGKEAQNQQQHQHSNTVLPTLPFHSHQELSLAERSLRRLVINSQFFPLRAVSDDWFRRPSSGGDGDRKPAPSESNSEEGTTALTTTHVTTLYEQEIRVEKLLGRGGFCEVRLAHLKDGISKNATITTSITDQEEEHPPSPHQCYAIKYLSPTISHRKSKKAFSRGAADLAIEARFLSLLNHAHIIHLHYVSAGSLHENYNCLDMNEDEKEGCSCNSSSRSGSDTISCDQGGFEVNLRHFGYFLLLDRLHETLDHRMKHTFILEVEFLTGEPPSKHHDHHRCCTNYSNMPHSIGFQQRRWLNNLSQWTHLQPTAFVSNRDDGTCSHPLKNLLARRLVILRSIATAVKYLHEHNIIFRDIKPDNIGFDECEIPKLFDFGLVKELKPSSRVTSMSCNGNHEDAVHKLTGRTGSRRYMSPEGVYRIVIIDYYSFTLYHALT